MTRPRVGFLGTGWIGLNRMAATVETGAIEPALVCDPSPEMVERALAAAPGARAVESLDEMLAAGVDGVVIATPSALHADQSIQALRAGAAVFCQKPLGRSAAETRAVVEAARVADRLLSVDFSYRFTDGLQRLREVVRSGELGRVFAIDLAFHNAYGPDKPWFYDLAASGGGCVMDLGVHLVDAALWLLDFPSAANVAARLHAGGEPVRPGFSQVEDYATATFELGDATNVTLACSWRLHAGQDAVMSCHVYGTEGGLAFRNVDGSFYDFVAERHRGTAREVLAAPPDAWGGRAAADWARRLAAGERFPAEAERIVPVAAVIDAIYGRG